MTNKEYLINVLTDIIDDGGASYDSVLEYNIACPYSSYTDCLNHLESNQYGTKEYEKGCIRCKSAWLNRKYDTYPSEDGKWEVEDE